MISAQELRIGNKIYFSYRYKNETVQREVEVTKLEKEHVTVNDGSVTLVLFKEESAQPIPLTPDILAKCGFKNPEGSYWIKDNDLMLALDSGWWWTNAWEADEEMGYGALATWREIQSLHQLQNLYFALTGTELNISL